MGQILAHGDEGVNLRGIQTVTPKATQIQNQNIVATHSKYNYNLRNGAITDYQYIENVKAQCFKSG